MKCYKYGIFRFHEDDELMVLPTKFMEDAENIGSYDINAAKVDILAKNPYFFPPPRRHNLISSLFFPKIFKILCMRIYQTKKYVLKIRKCMDIL